MTEGPLNRRYVEPLLEWAVGAGEGRTATRKLMHPLTGLNDWAGTLMRNCYRASLSRPGGIMREEFVQECLLKLLDWAKENTATLRSPEFDDEALARMICGIAKNYAISTHRHLQVLEFELVSDWQEVQLPRHSSFDQGSGWSHLEAEFQRAKKILHDFGRSLRGKKAMRQMLAAIVVMGRALGRLLSFPAQWFAYLVLRVRGKHLPDCLRDFLRQRFNDVAYEVISGRVTFLRNAFANYL